MKKLTLTAAVFSLLLTFYTKQLKAQVTSPTNTSFGFSQFVGFDGSTAGTGTAKPLEIHNDFNEGELLFYLQQPTALDMECQERWLVWFATMA